MRVRRQGRGTDGGPDGGPDAEQGPQAVLTQRRRARRGGRKRWREGACFPCLCLRTLRLCVPKVRLGMAAPRAARRMQGQRAAALPPACVGSFLVSFTRYSQRGRAGGLRRDTRHPSNPATQLGGPCLGVVRPRQRRGVAWHGSRPAVRAMISPTLPGKSHRQSQRLLPC